MPPALLFPTVVPGALAARAEQCRSLVEADFFSFKTEDRYPDIVGLARTDATTRNQARATARERLRAAAPLRGNPWPRHRRQRRSAQQDRRIRLIEGNAGPMAKNPAGYQAESVARSWAPSTHT